MRSPSDTRRDTRARRARRLRRTSPVLGAAFALGLVTTSCAPFVPLIGAPNCNITPADSVWRTNVTGQDPLPQSADWINTIGATKGLHADFGTTWAGFPNGIPYTIVDHTTPRASVAFDEPGESDPGPYPQPAHPNVEGDPAGSDDRHVLMVDADACKLYELYATDTTGGPGHWSAFSGAIWDMTSNAMRPDGWTSSDAAGLQVLPGLVRWEENNSGRIDHAIRITFPVLQKGYVWPASHEAAASTSTHLPHLGSWLRLKSTVDPNTFDPYIRPIIVALKTYGAIVADNSGPNGAFFISGAPDPRWDDDKLSLLSAIKGTNMWEFIDVDNPTPIKVANGSYQSAHPA